VLPDDRQPSGARRAGARLRVLYTALLCALLFVAAGAAQAQSAADTLLLDGKIVRFGAAPAEALAVRDGRIVALGASRDLRALAGPDTRVVDLGGRTVIPGLIDSDIHAIRAGLTFVSEVHWIGVRTTRRPRTPTRSGCSMRCAGQSRSA
jgi:hypothetical protein